MSPVEKSEEQYEVERLQIQEIFGETNFVISVDIEELDDILTNDTSLHIDASFFHFINNNEYVETIKHYIMNKPDRIIITKKDALFYLKQVGFTPLDNHMFIETFEKVKDTSLFFIFR
jgi:hypothetical protein